MAPHTIASFSVPLQDYAHLNYLLACTKIGCTRLQALAAEQHEAVGEPADWIILGGKTGQYVIVSQTWEWSMIASGESKLCIYELPGGTSIVTGFEVKCCTTCPGGGLGCASRAGAVPSYSLPRGYPPNVIIGYYAKDRSSFNFTVPDKTIRIGDLTYKLYGFKDMELEFVPTWIDYPDYACLTGEVTLTITISASDPKTTEKPMLLSTVWTRSEVIYVYVAAKGLTLSTILGDIEKDTVTVEVYAKELTEQGFKWRLVGNITASDDLVDNAQEVRNWKIDATKTVEIQIKIYYKMVGPKTLYPFECQLYCVGQTRSTTRPGFYVELIPYEYLTAG